MKKEQEEEEQQEKSQQANKTAIKHGLKDTATHTYKSVCRKLHCPTWLQLDCAAYKLNV